LIEFINQKIMIKTLFIVLFFALVLFAGVNAFTTGGHWRTAKNHRELRLKKSGKKIGRRAKKNTAIFGSEHCPPYC
jgi:thioredoxin-related protein